MHFAKTASWVVLACICAGTASAQTYVGNLNGSATASTFEVGGSTTDLTTVGWTEVSGDTRLFRGSANTAVISTGAYSTYTVRYDTGVALAANTLYTLSFDLGFMTSVTGNEANYSFQLGTISGGQFSGLGSAYSGALSYSSNAQLNIGNGNMRTVSSQWTTGSSVSGDNVAVTFSLLSYYLSFNSDYFGFDNVKLSASASAVPEPSTYAAIAGGVVLAGTVIVRRRRQRTAA